ncbi:MAG: hypothetical protein IPP42_01165 [Saprospiraceae bacterium]|nr:hypothetical protein [Saprospiraceae bacterium]
MNGAFAEHAIIARRAIGLLRWSIFGLNLYVKLAINSLHVLNVDYNTARFNTSEDIYTMYQYRYRMQGRSQWTTTDESNQHQKTSRRITWVRPMNGR